MDVSMTRTHDGSPNDIESNNAEQVQKAENFISSIPYSIRLSQQGLITRGILLGLCSIFIIAIPVLIITGLAMNLTLLTVSGIAISIPAIMLLTVTADIISNHKIMSEAIHAKKQNQGSSTELRQEEKQSRILQQKYTKLESQKTNLEQKIEEGIQKCKSAERCLSTRGKNVPQEIITLASALSTVFSELPDTSEIKSKLHSLNDILFRKILSSPGKIDIFGYMFQKIIDTLIDYNELSESFSKYAEITEKHIAAYESRLSRLSSGINDIVEKTKVLSHSAENNHKQIKGQKTSLSQFKSEYEELIEDVKELIENNYGDYQSGTFQRDQTARDQFTTGRPKPSSRGFADEDDDMNFEGVSEYSTFSKNSQLPRRPSVSQHNTQLNDELLFSLGTMSELVYWTGLDELHRYQLVSLSLFIFAIPVILCGIGYALGMSFLYYVSSIIVAPSVLQLLVVRDLVNTDDVLKYGFEAQNNHNRNLSKLTAAKELNTKFLNKILQTELDIEGLQESWASIQLDQNSAESSLQKEMDQQQKWAEKLDVITDNLRKYFSNLPVEDTRLEIMQIKTSELIEHLNEEQKLILDDTTTNEHIMPLLDIKELKGQFVEYHKNSERYIKHLVKRYVQLKKDIASSQIEIDTWLIPLTRSTPLEASKTEFTKVFSNMNNTLHSNWSTMHSSIRLEDNNDKVDRISLSPHKERSKHLKLTAQEDWVSDFLMSQGLFGTPTKSTTQPTYEYKPSTIVNR
ncbi:MAG: hypothetical protein CMF41_02510 [Legionellales bacterium]|nr:hypothetical protein [Legionellales bacterium]